MLSSLLKSIEMKKDYVVRFLSFIFLTPPFFSKKNVNIIALDDEPGVFIEPDDSLKINPFSAFCEILEEKQPEVKRKISEIFMGSPNTNSPPKKETFSKKFFYNNEKILRNSCLSLDVFLDGFEEISDSKPRAQQLIKEKEVPKPENEEKPTVDDEIISDISNFSFPKPVENFIKENAINNNTEEDKNEKKYYEEEKIFANQTTSNNEEKEDVMIIANKIPILIEDEEKRPENTKFSAAKFFKPVFPQPEKNDALVTKQAKFNKKIFALNDPNSLLSEIDQRMFENEYELKELKKESNKSERILLPFLLKNKDIIDLSGKSEKGEREKPDHRTEIQEAIDGFHDSFIVGIESFEENKQVFDEIEDSLCLNPESFSNSIKQRDFKKSLKKIETNDLIIDSTFEPVIILSPNQQSLANSKQDSPINSSFKEKKLASIAVIDLEPLGNKVSRQEISSKLPENDPNIQQKTFKVNSLEEPPQEQEKINIFSTIKEIKDQQKRLNYKRKLAEIREESNNPVESKTPNIWCPDQDSSGENERQSLQKRKKISQPISPWSICVYCENELDDINNIHLTRLCEKCLKNIEKLKKYMEVSLLDEPDHFEYIEKKPKVGPRHQAKIPNIEVKPIEDQNKKVDLGKKELKNKKYKTGFIKLNSADKQIDSKTFQNLISEIRKMFGSKITIDKICYVLNFFNYNAEECMKHLRTGHDVWFSFLNDLKI